MSSLANLASRPEYLALAVVTAVLSLISVGLSLSGRRRRLPRSLQTGLKLALWSFVGADLVVLLLTPYLASLGETHERAGVPSAGSASPSAPAAVPDITGSATPTPSFSREGYFDARGGIESVAGKARLVRQPDGSGLLLLSNLNATPGPDLRVYLSRRPSPGNDPEVKDGLELGALRANRGDLVYPVPAGELEQYRSVVVYCRSFSAIFGLANLI